MPERVTTACSAGSPLTGAVGFAAPNGRRTVSTQNHEAASLRLTI
jgi:hypothetical protein